MTTKEIINKIKQEAENKGLTRYRIAKKTGFTDAQIKAWFEGDTEPSIGKIITLCNAVGLKIEIKPLQ